MNRRSFFGFLSVAPVVLPVTAKALVSAPIEPRVMLDHMGNVMPTINPWSTVLPSEINTMMRSSLMALQLPIPRRLPEPESRARSGHGVHGQPLTRTGRRGIERGY